VVAGFTVINDVSARDWQWRTPTFTMGKSFDTHAPCGPWLVTTDELGDPGSSPSGPGSTTTSARTRRRPT
jgi:2-keto-4-pentenoate hydratase/2-oxohepta-3-ene-1,7-dioic acid hydratase in catechol pathway